MTEIADRFLAWIARGLRWAPLNLPEDANPQPGASQ